MRRLLVVCAIAVGLVTGFASPTSAIGLTQVTLTCDDGTTSTMVVDTDTLTGLTLAVQAMIDYPAGLTCTMTQVPLPGIVHIGGIALASPGTSPFIVGGGRWQVPCGALPGGGGGIGAPTTGGAAPQSSTNFVWVNIAVNFHQSNNGTFFGTLNETIPANQSCPNIGPVGESHFTSKPEASPTGCFKLDLTDPSRAYVISHVTQTSGLPFPRAANNTDIRFSFKDNGNPGHQLENDKLQGPPAFDDSNCPTATPGTPPDPFFDLVNGNITIHQ